MLQEKSAAVSRKKLAERELGTRGYPRLLPWELLHGKLTAATGPGSQFPTSLRVTEQILITGGNGEFLCFVSWINLCTICLSPWTGCGNGRCTQTPAAARASLPGGTFPLCYSPLLWSWACCFASGTLSCAIGMMSRVWRWNEVQCRWPRASVHRSP